MTMFRWNALENGALSYGMYQYGPLGDSIEIAKYTLAISNVTNYPVAIVRSEDGTMCIVEVLQCKPSPTQPLSA